jgi:hypothetical protein
MVTTVVGRGNSEASDSRYGDSLSVLAFSGMPLGLGETARELGKVVIRRRGREILVRLIGENGGENVYSPKDNSSLLSSAMEYLRMRGEALGYADHVLPWFFGREKIVGILYAKPSHSS